MTPKEVIDALQVFENTDFEVTVTSSQSIRVYITDDLWFMYNFGCCELYLVQREHIVHAKGNTKEHGTKIKELCPNDALQFIKQFSAIYKDYKDIRVL
jgi:hypothetical protein